MSANRWNDFMWHQQQHMHNPIKVSLDLHDESTYVYSVDLATGGLLSDCRVMGHYAKVKKHLKKIGPKGRIMIILEAGPHGFAPYRMFHNAGYEVKMIAPSSIPRAARDRKRKTDRDDAINNLHYHLSGNLRYVDIPSMEEESGRECLRFRCRSVWNITREKQRIHSLMKRQGKVFTLTKSYWTKKHYEWLRQIELSPSIRVVLDGHLMQIQLMEQQVVLLEKQLASFFNANPILQKRLNFYQLLAGFGPINSMAMVLEGRDFNRFRHPKQIMSFTGLNPGKRQSGNKDPIIAITKSGNTALRTAFVGAAKYYGDYRLLHSSKKIEKMPKVLGEFIQRCQTRLNHVYRSLKARGKATNKARVAVARELCGWLWEFCTKIIPVLDKEPLAVAA